MSNLIEKLQELRTEYSEVGMHSNAVSVRRCIEIVKERDNWISVDERLPDEASYVLVFRHNQPIEIKRYIDDADFPWVDIYVNPDGGQLVSKLKTYTHWRPLPEPPKGE